MIEEEIARLPDVEKRLKIEQKLNLVSEYIGLNEMIFSRASDYQKAGLTLFDALHLSCAETGKTIFLTTDNKIITIAKKIPGLSIRVENPVHWLMEVSADENNQ